MQELRPPGLTLSLIVAKIDDHFDLRPHRFDGCQHTRQCRSNCDAVSDTAEGVTPDCEPRSIPRDMIEVKGDLDFPMRDTRTWTRYHDTQIFKIMDIQANHCWRLSRGYSTSHQPSLTIDTRHWFPTSFRQRDLAFDDLGGSMIPYNITAIQHAAEQAHRLWFWLKRQLLGEFGDLSMPPSGRLGSGN